MNLMRRLFFSVQYLFQPPWDTGITPPELEAFVANRQPGRALDLGCGTGTNVIYLAQHGWEATGVDFIYGAIRKARKKAHEAGIEAKLLLGDVTRMDRISGEFDLILDIGCFHGLPVPDRSPYLDYVARLLAPEGTYLMYGFVVESDEGGIGVTGEDLQRLNSRLELVERQDGEYRGQKSAWFTWHKSDHLPSL